MRTDSLPVVARRAPRYMHGFIYVSREELAEKGLATDMKIFDVLVCDGDVCTVRAVVGMHGYLIWRRGERGPI